MKICAYCGNPLGTAKHQKTDEHVIPASLIKLFPEQDITSNFGKRYVDNRGMTISDVCASCNNGILSELDSYGKSIIEQYFYEDFNIKDYDTPFAINLNPNLFARWILKIIYNMLRINKMPTTYISSTIPYIMGETKEYPNNISIYIGTHININPVPEEVFEYYPLQINYNPIFEYVSFFRQMSGEKSKRLLLKGCGQSFSIRFASCIMLIILWKDTASDKNKSIISANLMDDFRFTQLHSNIMDYTVRCVSSPTNVMASNYCHFLSELAVQDTILNIKESIQGRDIEEAQKEFTQRWTPEMTRKGRALTEISMFPENKKKLQQYEKYYGKDK